MDFFRLSVLKCTPFENCLWHGVDSSVATYKGNTYMSSRVLMMVLIPYWDDRSSVTHCTLLMSFLFSPLLSLSSEELGVKLFAPLQYRCYHAQAHRS